MSCVIEGCKSHTGRKENDQETITFHRFPKNDDIKKEWLRRVRRPNWKWNKRSHICSKHFKIDDFVPNTNLKWRRLKENALPTLYLPDSNELESAPVPMDICDAAHGEASSSIMDSHINIDLQENIENSSSIYGMEVCELEATASTSSIHISEVDVGKNKEPLSSITNLCSTSSEPARCRHEAIISRLQRQLERVQKVSQRRLRKINTLTKRFSRQAKKADDLYNILMDRLKKENIETEYLTLLDNINKNDIIKRFLQKQGGDTLTRNFSNDLKKFAVTLHYLSPKAYTFIRDQFEDVLPHPKTISAWYKGIDCNPGFTSESLDAIKIRVQQNNDKPLFCALAIDEMAIRKLIEWDSHNQNYYGFANVGCQLDSDSAPVATQALTFMVTCLNDTWKIPVGYFLIHSIKSEQKATLVKQCIQLLSDCGVSVVSVTFDGAASNIAMSSHLGCDVSAGCVSFQCGESETEICLWPDPCHNIKLVRNAFADKKIFVDSDDNIISWTCIENLVKLQEDEGLHLGNKLKREHINFIKQKMKVRLATQLLSNSVADALQYCKDKCIPGFENCGATIKFIRTFNNLFDIFNSRNMRAKGWKRALTSFNIEETKIFFEAADIYIRNLKMADGTYLIDSNRKVGFNGFLVCMKSLLKIYHNIITSNKMQYLCTYKMSQDHLELFFGAIRAKCGFNNNPSARNFQAAYKRLLVHAQFKDGASGNSIPLEQISVLNYKPEKNPVDTINQSSGNVCLVRDIENAESVTSSLSVDLDHDYVPSPISLSEYSLDVVHYIAGFIVSKLKKSLRCETCIESLRDDENNSAKITLISVKNRGGLEMPSKDVFKICVATERIIKKGTVTSKFLGQKKNVMIIMNNICSTFVPTSIFSNLVDHSLEQNFDDNHRILLIKAICKLYLTVRIHHITKQEFVPRDKIRSFLTKTILFKGQ